jgi:8-hydroxy-5-deazaflavin:NADPH oxidoreductase
MVAAADPMTLPSIAVLGGSGQQGGGIAQRLARAGGRVLVGSRDPGRAAETIGRWPAAAAIESATYAAATAAAEVVVLAVPFSSAGDVLDACRPHFRPGALLLDVTVPLTFESGTAALVPVAEGSAAEHVKARAGAGVRIAAAFKTVPARLLNEIERPLDCDEFVCGDSAEARTDAAALVSAIEGLCAVDVGPLHRSRSIEHLTLLAIGINRRHNVHDARFRIVGL